AEGAGETLRPVGDELARLQLRARREAAELHGRRGRLLHVSAGRDRRGTEGQPRSRQLQVQDRLARARHLARAVTAPRSPAPPSPGGGVVLSRAPRSPTIYPGVIIP